MPDEDNPDPDALLKKVMRDETSEHKGKLKIFLGMSAGVGKTYAMLESAARLKEEGIDVVAGVIATHGRQETIDLLEGLEMIPQKAIAYKNSTFEEFDIDAVLARKPKVVLIDELAHSNIPGARHLKRWQDVLEILDHGIDVYTTLNVQHIESLKDVVEGIAGITIHETVPDQVLDQAVFIELIDITPNELLRRLKEGKVYIPDQSIIAARNFFQEERLMALREIVLRYAADKIDHDLKGMATGNVRLDAWKPRERLLVAVSDSPHSQKLIRATRRMAFHLDATWIAIHVDDGKEMNDESKAMLEKNLALVRDLGGEVIITSEVNVPHAIHRIAHQKSITQIVIGRAPKNFFSDLFQRNSLMTHLINECSDIDLHVIRQTSPYKSNLGRWRLPRFTSQLNPYLFVFLLVLALTVSNWFILPFIGYKVTGVIFLLGLLGMSLAFKKGPVFLASILYAFIWASIFVPSIEVSQPLNEDIILLVLYFLTAVCTGILTDRGRRNIQTLTKRERSIEALYEIVQEFAGSSTIEQICTSIKNRLNSVLEGQCEIIIKNANDVLPFKDFDLFRNEKELAAASWVFQNGKEAGWSTSTLPMCQYLYIPLKHSKETVGLIAYQSARHQTLSIEEKNFLYTVGYQLANYVKHIFSQEKSYLEEEARKIKKTYHSILDLLENLLEGPLLSVQESINTLKKEEVIPKENIQLERMQDATNDLFHILGNIAAMVRLTAGITPINSTRNNIKKLIRECYEKMAQSKNEYTWHIKIDDSIPDVFFDHDLIELLISNMIFHAIEFALPESAISIETYPVGDFIELSISGEGQTIPTEMLPYSFDNLYRLPGSDSSGLGMGLAVAEAIAEVHGGELKVKNRTTGGIILIFLLPIT